MKDNNKKEDDILTADSWRVFRIISEFVDGFETLTELGPSVSIFGSSRLKPASPYYNLSIDVATKIAKRGFAIITGGGPGLMEAANKGAQLANAKSCGIGISVPGELETNKFVDPACRMKFRYFFIRKVMFIRYAKACVFLPGGFGTLDELFETITLIQTEKITPFPIYLIGKSYWKGLLDWIKESPTKLGCIDPSELDLLTISDDPDFIAEDIERHYQQHKSFKNF